MKKYLIILLTILALTSLLFAVGCSTEKVAFDRAEYEVRSGDYVTSSGKKVTYRLATPTNGVEVAEDGKFTVSDTVADYTQVVLLAVANDKVLDEAVCTVRTKTITPTISFTNPSEYIVSGDEVNALSEPLYSVSYALKEQYAGITVNAVTGKIAFSKNVSDGDPFTVVATAKGVKAEKTFKAAVGNYVTATESLKISEYQRGSDVSFGFDFGINEEAEAQGVLKVTRGHTVLSDDDWSYDKEQNLLTVKKQAIAAMPMGDNLLKAVTMKNAVSLTVRVAKYIATAEELAAINDSREALSGYYVMVADIDLTDYLSPSGEGYNNGKGWNPIGVYHDVTDGTATDWAFSGTFDGNGHTISGFYITRSDDLAYNSGLFGYITAQGEVRNLGVKNPAGKVNAVRSYSGGFVGVNCGKIKNCWADVSVISGEVYRVLGGFVGRNEGEIENCYSLGRVSGGSNIGCFSGMSQTDVSKGVFKNCYAVKTENYPFSDVYDADTNKLFDSVEAMKNNDFSAYEENWQVSSGSLPVLKSTEIRYELRKLEFTNTEEFITRGDSITLKVVTNPAYAAEESGVRFSVVEGDPDCLNGTTGVINTRQLQKGNNYFKVKASCLDMEAFYEFYVYEKVSEVFFDEGMETVMHAGVSYKLDVTVLPLEANGKVDFELTEKLQGVTLDQGGIIRVSPYVRDGQFTVKVTAGNGKTDSLTVTVKANKTFDGNYAIVYRGETEYVTFTLPENLTKDIVKVTRYDKAVEYDAEGNLVKIKADFFTGFGTHDVPVKFITDSEVYAATVVCYDKDTVLEIGSVEEFLNYKEQIKTKPELLSKTLILTADLDFGGRTMTSVGSHYLGLDFSGVLNGNGHKISNLNIDRNDFSGKYFDEDTGVEKPDETVYPFHTSRYNVGLFSYVSGVVTNVCFENVRVASYFTGDYEINGEVRHYDNDVIGGFVGVVAGTLSGSVTNCEFIDCSASGGANVGVICGKNSAAVITNCRVDGVLQ